jgi:WD40 repeat protein
VWDTSTGQATGVSIRHRGPYSLFAAFSPDARRVVAAAGGIARIYDVERATGVGLPMKHVGLVGVAQFSPDGSLVLTASWDHTAGLWDARSGTPVSPPFRHEREIWYAEFSPDGRHLVTASADNTARVWDITPDARPFDELSELTKLLSGQRLSDAGTLENMDAPSVKSLWTRLRFHDPSRE